MGDEPKAGGPKADEPKGDGRGSQKRMWWIVAACAVAALVVAGAAIATSAGSGDDGVGSFSLPGGSGGGVVSAGSSEGTLGPGVAADADDAAGGTTGDGSSSGGSSSSDGAASGGGSSSGGGGDDTAAPTGFMLRLAWWNETEDRAPTAMVVAWAGGTWKPTDPTTSEVAEIGPMKVGKTFDLKVYPDGPSGAEVVVPITITDTMKSGSEVDGIHIEVTDDIVRVLGLPVENFEQIHERP